MIAPYTFKLNQLYIINEESPIKLNDNTSTFNDSLKFKSLENYILKSKFQDNPLFFIKNVDVVSQENLRIIDKLLREEYEINIYNSLTIKMITKESLNLIFKFLGFNIVYCQQLSENVFSNLIQYLQLKYEIDNTLLENGAVCTYEIFFDIIKLAILQISKKKCHFKKYFHLAYLAVSKYFDFKLDKKISIIVILGGTSGTGKSTLASLLASRIGVSTLSTDSIRHILRNFLEKEDHPEIFASTYEAHEGISKINILD